MQGRVAGLDSTTHATHFAAALLGIANPHLAEVCLNNNNMTDLLTESCKRLVLWQCIEASCRLKAI